MLKIKERGFTLLEVLITVAIIGLLASVVIFSIRESKHKGTDAAIQSALMQAKDQAEVYYNFNDRSYEGLCANDPNDLNTIGRFLIAARNSYGGTVQAPYADTQIGRIALDLEACHDSVDGYVAYIPLVHNNTIAWCIDGNNYVGETSGVINSDDMICP